MAGTVVLALASFGGGATRHRGGVLEALGLSFFSFGHGRNLSILGFWTGVFLLVAAWVGVGKYLVAPVLAKRNIPDAFSRLRTTVWVWVAPLLLAGPIASRDVYSYLMQGAMVRDGFDPYTQGAAVNPGPFLLEVSQDWRNTTTPYGPLHLLTGNMVTSVVGDNVTAGIVVYKLLSVAGFLAISWAVPRIATALGGNPVVALWLGVANPVMIIHLVGGMHNESIMVALVSLGLLAALRGGRGSMAGGVGLIALAVSLKATAFLAMPFVLWLFINRATQPAKKFAAFLAGGVVIVAETALVLAAVTALSGVSWGWLTEISGNSKVINPLAGPTLLTDFLTPLLQLFDPEVTYNGVLSAARTAGMICMLVGLVVVWWLARGGRRQAIFGTVAAYQVAFAFNSVTLPWYFASSISLVGTPTPPRWLLKLATGGSVVVALAFAGDGNHQLYNWWWMLATAAGAWWAAGWIFDPQATKARA
ncbi:alpha-(1-_6)-mannopyranosyltransferase A [Corynebacterium phocae]|uniref:alpha-(1->6)-mannopyranosyltransferase A n=1 Tax=Corynebacterium phocae TaxID=161895 RepID=UPI003183BC29